jgi:biofilm PGA synthesis lipoprotein PgaB
MKVKPKSGIIISSILLLLILAMVAIRLPSDFSRKTSSALPASGIPVSGIPASVRYLGKARLSQVSLRRQLQIPSTYKDKVAVLMYHDVEPGSNNTITVTPERLDADLTLLQQKGFHIIPVSQMAAFMEHRTTVPEKAVVLTFDDGYEGVYRYAFPVLKKHNAPATIFIIGYYVGRLPGYLTWPEVRQLEESGLVTAGGHTYNQHVPEPANNPNLVEPATIGRLFNPQTGREETDKEYEARMLSDSNLFQNTLNSELGHTTPYFAYPYGAYNATMIKILLETGFRYMFTTMTGVNDGSEDPTRLYRINAGATWISTKNLPWMILKAAFYSSPEKQPLSYLPEWKA